MTLKYRFLLYNITIQGSLSRDIYFYTYLFEIQCNDKKLLLIPTQKIHFEFVPLCTLSLAKLSCSTMNYCNAPLLISCFCQTIRIPGAVM